jgi:hypothetical protein
VPPRSAAADPDHRGKEALRGPQPNVRKAILNQVFTNYGPSSKSRASTAEYGGLRTDEEDAEVFYWPGDVDTPSTA